MARRPPRSRRPSRGRPKQPLRPRVIVVTEGEKTEPQYINEFLRIHGAPNVHIGGTGFDPLGVVEKAIELKKNLGRGTRAHVWAVFDRDEHPRFEEALQLAQRNCIRVAVSNPCFELWAVFHYQDYAAHIERHECQRLLARLCKSYRADRGKLFNDTDAIRSNHDAAVQRGKRSLHDRKMEGDPQGNPSTSMHVLMESIRTQKPSAGAPRTKGSR